MWSWQESSQPDSFTRTPRLISPFGLQAALKELEDAALAAERAERAEAGESEAPADTDPLQVGAAEPKKGGKAKGGRKITGKVSH